MTKYLEEQAAELYKESSSQETRRNVGIGVFFVSGMIALSRWNGDKLGVDVDTGEYSELVHGLQLISPTVLIGAVIWTIVYHFQYRETRERIWQLKETIRESEQRREQ